jgi:diguanylate cyclase (GGDEF)-like protein/PAS domain S-box-containing protein
MSDSEPDNLQVAEACHRLAQELEILKQQNQALVSSENRFRLALRGANDGLWDWNLENNEVYYSPRWKSMLGYEEHELNNILDTWADLVHPDEKDAVLGKVREYLSGKRDSFETEMRMRHKDGHYLYVLSRAYCQYRESDNKPIRLIGTHVDITSRKNAETFIKRTAEILEMIALGKPASEIYDAIALLYENKHPGMRCSMLELSNGVLLHGGAPSLPKEYCDAVHGLKNGPEVGSCGASTFNGERCLVENIATHLNWSAIKQFALPHGMRCCWSEPIKSSKGEILGAFGMYYDFPALPNEEELEDLVSAARLAGIVMERDHDQKRIRDLAYTDTLTGIASRTRFYQYIEDLIKASRRHNRKFGLLYIDLDNFKYVNDSLGHDTGDQLLKVIGVRLTQACRESDFVARLSGDEFSIVVEETEGAYTLSKVAERYFDIISQPLELSGRTHTPNCSIGIAHYPDDGHTLENLVKAADTALYSAKELGKNRYAFYKPELTEKAEYRFRFEQLLREAITNQQLTLEYQPQVEVHTGKITGVEALCRWHHPSLGQVPPLEFIEAAERIGMIKHLTEWVLITACSQAMAWKSAGIPPIRMAVNISPSHFLDPEIVDLVTDVVNQTQMDPRFLQLEVTEDIAQTDIKNLSVFEKLKEIGVQIAIDDFGTGYSSLASLKHLDVDCMKIDQVFIKDMLTDMGTKFLVSSMVGIGQNLGHSTIAEGVETEEQLILLQKLGCETAQGYFLCRPMQPAKLENYLSLDSVFTTTTNQPEVLPA